MTGLRLATQKHRDFTGRSAACILIVEMYGIPSTLTSLGKLIESAQRRARALVFSWDMEYEGLKKKKKNPHKHEHYDVVRQP